MPTQQTESPIYQSYLVRFWRDKPSSPWRISLQSMATEQVRHFATLDEYLAFSQARLAVKRDDPIAPPLGDHTALRQTNNRQPPTKPALRPKRSPIIQRAEP